MANLSNCVWDTLNSTLVIPGVIDPIWNTMTAYRMLS